MPTGHKVKIADMPMEVVAPFTHRFWCCWHYIGKIEVARNPHCGSRVDHGTHTWHQMKCCWCGKSKNEDPYKNGGYC